MIYKNKVPTIKFAIFEKNSAATEWCKNVEYPINLMTDMKDEIKHNFSVDTFLKAQNITENLFEKGFDKIIAEQVKDGHYFTTYYLTDSSSHVLIGNFYKNKKITIFPDFQISKNIQENIFNNYYLKILNSLNYNNEPFFGILKLDFLLTENELFLNDVGANFNIADFQMMLQFLDVNIFNLFSSVLAGTLEDFENIILTKDNYFASLETEALKPLFEEDDNVKCIEIRNDKFVYISQASTVNRACEFLNEI